MRLAESWLGRKIRSTRHLRAPAIAAYRALDRILPAPLGPRIVLNSMPKSGTHLLAALLDQLAPLRYSGQFVQLLAEDFARPEIRVDEISRALEKLRPSRYLSTHLPADPLFVAAFRSADVRLVTILRDPRAAVVSAVNYVISAKRLVGREELLARYPTKEDLLQTAVYGEGTPNDASYRPGIATIFKRYASWLDAGIGIVVRFEDLVGEEGGASAQTQLETIERILGYLGYEDVSRLARSVAGRIFSRKSMTFRTGSVDAWRKELPANLAAEVSAHCHESMRLLGYS